MKRDTKEYQQYSHLKNNVLFISTGINNLTNKIMVKKIKYYVVFVNRTIKNELPKELIEMLSKHGEFVGLNSPNIELHVFDNELEQIECALNIEGTGIETIDAVDKADFLAQVDKLKEKYPNEEEDHCFPD